MTKRQKDKERLGKRPNFPNYSRSYIYIHTRIRHLWSIRWYFARLPLVVPVRISQAPSPSPWRISTLTLPTHSAAPPHCVHLTLSKVGGLHSTPPSVPIENPHTNGLPTPLPLLQNAFYVVSSDSDDALGLPRRRRRPTFWAFMPVYIDFEPFFWPGDGWGVPNHQIGFCKISFWE